MKSWGVMVTELVGLWGRDGGGGGEWGGFGGRLECTCQRAARKFFTENLLPRNIAVVKGHHVTFDLSFTK